MTDLIQSLKQHDEPFLLAVQSLWNIEQPTDDLVDFASLIANHLLNKDLIKSYLFDAADVPAQALKKLIRDNGKTEAKSFFQLFGEIRLMGEARFMREKPWLGTLSAAEWLWYRGVIYTGIFDDGSE